VGQVGVDIQGRQASDARQGDEGGVVAPTLDRAPSLAEVQAQVLDREQRVVQPNERAQRRRDYQHAAVVERQQALQQIAPGSGVAWQVTKGLKLPAIPLDPVTLEPVAEGITDPMAVLAHWSQPAQMAHAVGVRLGAQRGGAVALVGLKADTWGAWQEWVQANAVIETVRPWSDEDLRRGEMARDLRPLGAPSVTIWTAPPGPPVKSFSAKGDKQLREGSAWWRQINTPPDRGGYSCWTVAPHRRRGVADFQAPPVGRRPPGPGLR
jgi:hypothetical protein